MKAMVLAAGVGSRLDPLTATLPKPLVPVVNKPVMEHIVSLLRKHDFTDICANLHYLPQNITEYFGDGSKFGVNLTFEMEAQLSGDAGGVRACRKFLQTGTFIVIMGDLITDADLGSLVQQHREKKALASIAVKKMDDVTRFGVVVRDKNDFITGFQEKPKQEDALSDLISTGIYILEPEVFNFIPETGDYGFGRQLFPSLVERGERVLGLEIETYWSDVGTIDQYRESNLHALSGLVKLSMPAKITGSEFFNIVGNSSAYLDQDTVVESNVVLSGNLLLGRNSRIGSGTTITGNVVIGDDCIIDGNCELKDSVIWSGTHVQAGASINSSVVGSDCVVQQKSRLNNEAVVTPLKNGLSATAAR
jgi:mannose-1-phosphate guanylyltransferase/mannose-1-phosphate guanylyltransferase/phosphomannomutase